MRLGASCTPPEARGSKIVFVVTEDWFFASHFLPMVEAARSAGLAPVVVTRVGDHHGPIEAAGARVVALDAERRDFRLASLASTVRRLAGILREERPAIVHCISLRSIVVGGMAARLAGARDTVYALTGLGLLGARQDRAARLLRSLARQTIRRGLSTPRTHFLLENRSDAEFLGLSPDEPRLLVVGGAGVDPDRYAVAPLPGHPPLALALVARMLWSKGVDTAVEAVTALRREGLDVTLSIYGTPDASNPRAIPAQTLLEWSHREGIEWKGRTEDVAAVWAAHHAAVMPSRGGEGLPRSILEAAACGRAVLTTDVPGCRDFVRDGVEGFLTAPGDAQALAGSIRALASDEDLATRMGSAARSRVFDGYRTCDVIASVAKLYERMMVDRDLGSRDGSPADS